MLWLSEESTTDFVVEFFRGLKSTEPFKNLILVSELDINGNYGQAFLDKIKAVKPAVVLFDNITTSEFYECKVDQQSRNVKWFKKLAIDHNFAFVCFAHTVKKFGSATSELISENDIQGTSAPSKLAEFIFIMQSVYIGSSINSVLRICKNRGQIPENKIFTLNFDPKYRMYNESIPITFDRLRELFKDRNKV